MALSAFLGGFADRVAVRLGGLRDVAGVAFQAAPKGCADRVAGARPRDVAGAALSALLRGFADKVAVLRGANRRGRRGL